MSIFEKESSNFQNRNYREHLNRNWDNGNKQFDAMNARINAKAENSAPGEVIQARIDANGNVYKSLAGRLDANQKVAENASYIANSAYTYSKTELYKKLSQMNNGVKAFTDINKLKQAYPNGSDGIFVTVDTGHQWYYVDGLWRDAGIYQASSYDSELRDARVELDGTNANTIGNAIRDQFFKEKKERIADLNAESIERSKADAQIEDRLNLAETALELKEVRLRDEQNRLLWNGNSYVTGKTYLPKTDKTGLEEGVPVDSSIIGYTFLGHLKEYGLPILKLESPDLLDLKTKAQGKLKDVKFDYDPNGFEGHNGHKTGVLKSIKIQGASSAQYPKKNYTLGFDYDVQFKSSWGAHHKYVIKADWVDFSHMRNEFGAQLWRSIRKTRINPNQGIISDNQNILVDDLGRQLGGETLPQFSTPNYGAIDSFPILVYINDSYNGLYSMTIPKDDWMAGMGKGEQEAIVSAEEHSKPTQFKANVNTDSDGNPQEHTFGIEYVTNEKTQKWVSDNLNRAITAIIAGSNIEEYIDMESAIDYLIINALIANTDGVDKNFLLQTWDGNKWYFATYDMDGTMGNLYNGQSYVKANQWGFRVHAETSKSFEYIINNMKDDLVARWKYLRKDVLNEYSLPVNVRNWAIKTPQAVLDYEKVRWPSRPGTRTNNVSQIVNWFESRLKYLDEEIDKI